MPRNVTIAASTLALGGALAALGAWVLLADRGADNGSTQPSIDLDQVIEERADPPPATTAAEGANDAGANGGTLAPDTAPTPTIPLDVPLLARAEIVTTFGHDATIYTQGLVDNGATYFESGGQYGESVLAETDATSGEILRSVPVDDELFAEGLERIGDRLIQLTWKAGRALVYDVATFEQIGEFSYDGQGWGLCQLDESTLVMSSGAAELQFRDPITFELLGTVEVAFEGSALNNLNELECAGGRVYANIWKTRSIVRIDPTTGDVDQLIDASSLPDNAETFGAGVLNGIAYDPDTGLFRLTGKNWSQSFDVRFIAIG